MTRLMDKRDKKIDSLMDERDKKIASLIDEKFTTLIDEKINPMQDLLKKKFPEDFTTTPTVSSSPAPGTQDDFEIYFPFLLKAHVCCLWLIQTDK